VATAIADAAQAREGLANEALARLLEAGVICQMGVGRRNRAFEAPDVVAAFTDLERQLASPAGNTSIAAPACKAPARRAKR
jgi:hypothetical protein